MKNMFDINTNILPFVEDGVESFHETKEMLELAIRNGTTRIIATPHRRHVNRKSSIREVKASYVTVKRYIEQMELPIQLYLGNEIEYDSATLDRLNQGELLTMANTVYVLIQFEKNVDYNYILRAIYILTQGGYRPIIAHIQQYTNLQTINDYEKLKEMGAYFQLDDASLYGGFFCPIRRRAKQLLKLQLIDFIASNTPNEQVTAPNLGKHVHWVIKKCGKEYANRIYCENAILLVNNQELDGIRYEAKSELERQL